MVADARAIAEVLAESSEHWCWFDRERPAPGERRVSLLGIAAESRECAQGAELAFLAHLRRELGTGSIDGRGDRRTGFSSGWAIALAYEFGASLLVADGSAGPSRAHLADSEEPVAIALRIDAVIAVDHELGTVELRGANDASLDAWSARHATLLARLAGIRSGDRSAPPAGDSLLAEGTTLAWRSSDDAYLARIDACLRSIRDGDAYVLCLTDSLAGAARPGRRPLEFFDRLRAAGPAIRGGVLVAGKRALISASPERFLAVSGSEVRTDPMKGTRPRDTDPKRDRARAAELAADPKEAAENLMIVDLMRNDLARVCEPGSVSVQGFLRVESHPHVHQLVSTVSGQLAEGNTVIDALITSFPGGSMTGAPKRRAVELLAEFEAGARGLYSGCFGWIDASGDAELAMTIRSVELRGDRILIGAGGGITADSAPLRELDEKHLKARSLIAALQGDSEAE